MLRDLNKRVLVWCGGEYFSASTFHARDGVIEQRVVSKAAKVLADSVREIKRLFYHGFQGQSLSALVAKQCATLGIQPKQISVRSKLAAVVAHLDGDEVHGVVERIAKRRGVSKKSGFCALCVCLDL
ncbi:hypothetical protein BASA81_001025 [Batrachochytrium salamandrivorans]|nr:hypothetical protein BASA81_001025 [Batrachochytrium salamandrivorans]